MRRIGVAATLLATMAVGGCGFTPLYGDHGGQAAALGQISVALIPDRNGQMLRQDLQDRLERNGGGVSSRYDLYVFLAIYGNDIAIDPQSASTRSRQIGAASWTLKAQDVAHTVLSSGNAHSLDGFDVINQQFFAVDMSREAAARRIDDALADQITQQLAVYFRQHPAS
jgi:LPS-assembly lipoprotein